MAPITDAGGSYAMCRSIRTPSGIAVKRNPPSCLINPDSEIQPISRQQVAQDLCCHRTRAGTDFEDPAGPSPFAQFGNQCPRQETTTGQKGARISEMPP